jgi:hypothetical protein
MAAEKAEDQEAKNLPLAGGWRDLADRVEHLERHATALGDFAGISPNGMGCCPSRD